MKHIHLIGRTILLGLALVAGSWPVVAAEPTHELPEELMFHGQPIEPDCMDFATKMDSSSFDPVDLATCKAGDIVPDTPPSWNQHGEYGYSHKYNDTSLKKPYYIYYRFLGYMEGLPVVLIRAGGGGSGKFDFIIRIERKADTLRLIDPLVIGDRCNGGISKARVENGALSYEQEITPFDFLTLADDNPHDLKAYKSLEASAASCFGTARYAADKLVSVRLKPDAADEKGWTEQYRYQRCFNRLYREYIVQGKNELSPALLKEFTHVFNKQCVEAPDSGMR